MRKIFPYLYALLIGSVYIEMFPQYLRFDISERPYVYRQLVPILSTILDPRLVVTGFLLLMVAALLYLYESVYPQGKTAEVYVMITTSLVILLAIFPPHSYDIPTVALFTLSLAFLKNRKWLAFVLLFPIVSLNRETSILLIGFFVVYAYNLLSIRKIMGMTGVMILIYAGIKLFLWQQFGTYSGYDTKIYFGRNIQIYANNPFVLMTTLLMVLSILSMLSARWERTNSFLKLGLLFFFPILTIAYLVVGITMELRVFLEVLPILVMIGLPHGSEIL